MSAALSKASVVGIKADGAAGSCPAAQPALNRSLMNVELLRVMRRELANTLQPELTSSYAQYVAGLMTQMLDYMADWESGEGYPDIDRRRSELLACAPGAARERLKFLPELDDPSAIDEALANAIRAAASSNDDTTLRKLGPVVGAIDDALYAGEKLRHSQANAQDAALLAAIDPDLTVARIDAYASAKLGISDPAASVTKIPGGHSKDTFLVVLESGRELVVRRDFPFGPVNTSAADEFGILHYLFEQGLPVPRPIAAEHDPSWLGQKCLLMERVAGQNAELVGLANPETGREIALQLAGILARLHRADPVAAGLIPPGGDEPREAVRRYLASWRAWWDRHRIHASSLGEIAHAWLERHIPQNIARVVIVHGDARPGNMLLQDGTSTLLDWEFAHAGDPAEDLLYAKGFVEPFMQWDEFLQAYVAQGGAKVSEEGTRYYDVFRSWRNMVCTDVSWGGFVRRDYPAFKLGVQGVVHKRYLAQELAKSMKLATWASKG